MDATPPPPGPRDLVDAHVERWTPLYPALDPDIEGAVVRMQKLVGHLARVKARGLAAHDLAPHEFDTLFALVGAGGGASPSALASGLDLAPASVTGRIDGLEQRGYVRRVPSATDRRRTLVHLTDEGRAVWQGAIEVMGGEEERLLHALDADERRLLSDLLRKVTLRAYGPEDPSPAPPPPHTLSDRA
ncbi:MarR family winged helix-turn-helix transcriptional regulator [Streptomyces sp. P6-2-1]|uniref:MarR family winged helix-turn-helix transcriptional regulator n=1 Tax=unclassified Streptomyces TaxID=2593676 RepID=UPI003D36EF46